eukprot:TRINITY_DN5006_c0_g1_i1.p1 TRINITY_DN5006_c0_g1~~TRINITY_DN5006_c0_g1_i1.p1  ORF type:complete len:191 (-),score=18.68 TRINITY_DN5006_c0_g1_i1:123-695(-)
MGMKSNVDGYPTALRWLHMVIGICILLAIVFAKFWQWSICDACMFRHKSFGFLIACLSVPWTYYRFKKPMPKDLPPSSNIPSQLQPAQTLIKKLVWYALHAVVPLLGLTGIVMGYFGGKGVPFFFGILIPGKGTPIGDLAKVAHDLHVVLGKAVCLLVFFHLSGSTIAWLEGQPVVRRMSPFASSKTTPA